MHAYLFEKIWDKLFPDNRRRRLRRILNIQDKLQINYSLKIKAITPDFSRIGRVKPWNGKKQMTDPTKL